MHGKPQNTLVLLMTVFGVLFIVSKFDFQQLQFDSAVWVDLGLVSLFYILLFQFWNSVKASHENEVTKASITDALSNLYTAHHFFYVLEAEIDRSSRMDHSLSILYLDVDYFHRYNDKHGMQSGDKVLKFIGELIRFATRAYDTGFRFGKDEFVLVLPETNRVEARLIAERLRDNFFNNYGGELGLSIGVSNFDKEQDDVDRMLRKALAAMEESRRGGGNRTRAYIERGQL